MGPIESCRREGVGLCGSRAIASCLGGQDTVAGGEELAVNVAVVTAQRH